MRIIAPMMILIMMTSTLAGCTDWRDDKTTSYCEDDSFIDYDSHYGCRIVIDFKQDVEISWNITIPEQDNPNYVDVYLIDSRNLDDYTADEGMFGSCEDFVYIEEVSLEFVGNWGLNKTTVSLDSGEWYFIVDNKRCTGANPEDDLRVSSYFEIEYVESN